MATSISAGLKNVAFVLGAVWVLVGAPLAYVLAQSAALSALVLLSALLFTLLVRFENIEEIALGSLRARLRATISETAATIRQVRELAAITTQSQLANLIGASFVAGMPEETRSLLASEFLANAKALGLDDRDIERVTEPWRRGVAQVYVREIGRRFFENATRDAVNYREWQQLNDFRTWTAPSPQQVRSFLEKWSFLDDPAANALLRDYEAFAERKDGYIPNLERLVERIESPPGR